MTHSPTPPPPLDYHPPSAPEQRRLAHRLATRIVAAFFAALFAFVTVYTILGLLGCLPGNTMLPRTFSQRCLEFLPASLLSAVGFLLCLLTALGRLAPKHPWARNP